MTAEITSHMMMIVLKERNRYHAALVALAGDCGCTLRTPADPSERPSGTTCRARCPDHPAEWCYACVASAALEPDVDEER